MQRCRVAVVVDQDTEPVFETELDSKMGADDSAVEAGLGSERGNAAVDDMLIGGCVVGKWRPLVPCCRSGPI